VYHAFIYFLVSWMCKHTRLHAHRRCTQAQVRTHTRTQAHTYKHARA